MENGRVVIIGGSGFLGAHISRHLLENSWEVVVVDHSEPRVKGVQYVEADVFEGLPRSPLLQKPRAVINLMGKSIAGRWTKERKQRIYDSRVESTKNIVRFFEDITYRPEVLINASAVGIYGDRGNEELLEVSSIGEGFLARVCRDWERAAREAEKFGIRVALMRQATAIGNGGLLKSLKLLLALSVLLRFGKEGSWLPWIHVDDLARAYDTVIRNPDIHGPVNVSAPEAVRHEHIFDHIKKIWNARIDIRIPEWLETNILGGLGHEFSFSQRVVPQVLKRHGFEWKYPNPERALRHVHSRQS